MNCQANNSVLKCWKKYILDGVCYFLFSYIQVHLKKINIVKKFTFSCNLFQKVELSYILDSLNVTVHGVLYQSILNANWLEGRNWIGKRCTSNRDDRKLWEYCQSKLIQTLGGLDKELTEAGVSASRVTTLRHLQEKGATKPLLKQTSSEASYLG